MNDRELLELAAKAAGYSPWGADCEGYPIFVIDDIPIGWNPLADDGDAFRLAVHLALFNGAQMFHFRSLERFGNPQASELECTRRAIVRAAAEIGRQMIP